MPVPSFNSIRVVCKSLTSEALDLRQFFWYTDSVTAQILSVLKLSIPACTHLPGVVAPRYTSEQL